MMDIKSSVAEARNEYTYSASGQKLKVVQKWNSSYSTSPVIGSAVNTTALNMNKTTDYVGNKIYENNALKRILVDGGYIEGGVYYFYLTDHLGNNRVVANASGTAIQKTHYYPFGMAFAENTGRDKQPYKYNGKELDAMHGLNMYDYSARYYDSNLGRFSTVDPHAENYYNISPYVYAANNPINVIDPNGMDSVKINGQNHDREGFLFKFIVNLFNIGSRVVNDHSKLIGETSNWALGNQNPTFEENVETTINVYSLVFTGTSLAKGMGRSMFSGYSSGTNSNINSTGSYLNSDPYAGVKDASKYLRALGVNRQYRKQILQSFDAETISLITANNSTYGLRFYGGGAAVNGKYLFPTFSDHINRAGLALRPEWNSMTNISQFKIPSGTQYIYGRAASQGSYYPVVINGKMVYRLHKITSGENQGNYVAVAIYGQDEDGYEIYEYQFVVGADKVDDFRGGETEGSGYLRGTVKLAVGGGMNGRAGFLENAKTYLKNQYANSLAVLFAVGTSNPMNPKDWMPSISKKKCSTIYPSRS